jgi:hypothetical protein
MANGNRVNASDARRAPVLRRGALSSDPTLPRTLVSLVYATSDTGQARPQRRPEAAAAARRRPLPQRLPTAIAAEMPPNILYRRYPLVTSLLVELDELRQFGVLPPTRRGR